MCRWTRVRVGGAGGGILLIMAAECMSVIISSLGAKDDGLTDLYRETSSFANYLNTLGRSFLEAVVECWNERLYPSLSKEFLSRLLVHPPCRVKSHFLMSFKKGEYQHAFPVDWGGNMHGGLPLRVRIWWKNEEKKNPVNMSDSQQARADAWLHSRNPPSGERVKWNRKSRQCS